MVPRWRGRRGEQHLRLTGCLWVRRAPPARRTSRRARRPRITARLRSSRARSGCVTSVFNSRTNRNTSTKKRGNPLWGVSRSSTCDAAATASPTRRLRSRSRGSTAIREQRPGASAPAPDQRGDHHGREDQRKSDGGTSATRGAEPGAGEERDRQEQSGKDDAASRTVERVHLRVLNTRSGLNSDASLVRPRCSSRALVRRVHPRPGSSTTSRPPGAERDRLVDRRRAPCRTARRRYRAVPSPHDIRVGDVELDLRVALRRVRPRQRRPRLDELIAAEKPQPVGERLRIDLVGADDRREAAGDLRHCLRLVRVQPRDRGRVPERQQPARRRGSRALSSQSIISRGTRDYVRFRICRRYPRSARPT